MDPKDADNAIKSAERTAEQERKRILEEMAQEAAELMREKRVHFPAPDTKGSAESEGDYVRRFRKHVAERGMRALVDKPG